MSCLSSTVRAEKQAQLVKLETQLAAAEAAYLGTMSAGGTGLESYRFDSAEGSQSAKLLDPSKLQDQISFLESRINRIKSELRGTGIHTNNLRRWG